MFCPFSREKNWHKLRKVCDNQIDKPQRGRPKKAELPDVNINTGAQSINTKRASLMQDNELSSVLTKAIRTYSSRAFVPVGTPSDFDQQISF